MDVVSFPSAPRMSGYHSAHFPAVQPMGFEGMLMTCAASLLSVRLRIQRSMFVSTNTAVGPAIVIVRRTSYMRNSRSLPYRSAPTNSERPRRSPPGVSHGSPAGWPGAGDELRVVEALCRSRELQLPVRRRERHPGVAALVVLEVVVVVGEKERGNRATVDAVERDDLRPRGLEQDLFVARAEH